MGKGKKVSRKLIILLGLAGVLLIILVIERSLLKHASTQTLKAETPIVVLPPSSDKSVVYLDKSSEWEILFGEIPSQSILAKELVRQAFLLSAREEGGLLTRDAWLGDAMPDAGPDEPFNIIAKSGHPNNLTIEVGPPANRKKIAALELVSDADYYKDLLQKTEELSRGKFLTALKNGGYILKSKKAQSDEKLPPEIEKLLREMNYFSQYSAIRQLHELICTRGESAELQGGLVRGYANLGVLTEYNWHPAFKVFFARSMLYAQRMVAQGNHPRWAKWHRAYAYALAGLQKWALKDLKDAEQEAQNSARGENTKDYAKPAWVDIINAFCRYDTKSLYPDWDQAENAELTGLMQTVANELAMNGDLIVTQAMKMLEELPECYRLYNVVCRFGGVIVGHPGTTVCSEVFRDKSYQRMAKIPGMPENVAKIVRKRSSGGGLLARFFGRRDDNPPDEFQVRRELIAALFATGKATKAEQTAAKQSAKPADSGEPSWATLGLLIREMSFAQVWRRIYFEAHMLGVAPDNTLKELKPLYADHPYGKYLDVYSWDQNVKNKAVEEAWSIQMDEVLLQSFPLYEELARLERDLGYQLAYNASSHMDFTSIDMIRGLICRMRVERKNTEYIKVYAHDINDISPWSPFAGSLLIENDWDTVSKDLPKWEELAASHPGLMRTIAWRYYKDKHTEDAERCLKTAISVSPDKDSFRMLADIYKEKGDKKKYLDTLEEFLKFPDYHLDHGKICEEIAYYYMSDRKWHKALPYAERAAETYSAWGLICEANCRESLREWDKAEQFHKACALRYRDSAMDWYLFCKRTGKGDLESARNTMLEFIERKDKRDNYYDALYYLIEKQPEKSLPLFENDWDKFKYPFEGLMMALTAAQLKDSTKCNEILKTLCDDKDTFMASNDTNKKRKELLKLAKMISDDLAQEQSKLDLQAADKLVSTAPEWEYDNLYYFLGKYLDLRGKDKEAVELWKKCVSNWWYMGQETRTLSAVELRNHGISEEEIDSILPAEKTEEDKENKKE